MSCGLWAAAAALVFTQPPPPSWPQWRGPNRDGVAAFSAPAVWPQQLTKRWEVTVGLGHSSPVVAGDWVIVHAREGNREIARAFDLQTGKPLWQNGHEAPYTMNPAARAHGPGPKSTPAIVNGRVFMFGISGILSAIDLVTGRTIWRTDVQSPLPLYGTAMSPIVDGSLVFAHMGGHDQGALTAFDVATGTPRWRWTGDGPAYASPVIAEIGATRQLITQTQNALVGLAVGSGQLLWRVPLKTPFDQNVVTPLVIRDLVIFSGLEYGTAAIRIVRKGAAWTTEPVWKNEDVSMYMSSPAVNEQVVFGLANRNRGQFFALDLATGKTLWTSRGREGENASIIRAGALLLLFTTNAELIVGRVSAKGFEELKRYTVANSAMWAHPAVVGTQIIVKDVDKLICWSL